MLANPPVWLAWPPCLAISETSSLGRLAKLPGLVLPVEDMVVVVMIKLEFCGVGLSCEVGRDFGD